MIPASLLTRKNLNSIVRITDDRAYVVPDVQVLVDYMKEHYQSVPHVNATVHPVTKNSVLHRWIVLDLLSSLQVANNIYRNRVPSYGDTLGGHDTEMLWVTQPTTKVPAGNLYCNTAIWHTRQSVELAIRVAGNVGLRNKTEDAMRENAWLRLGLLCAIEQHLPEPVSWRNVGNNDLA